MFDTRSSGVTAMNIQVPASSGNAALQNAPHQETDGAKSGFKISAGSSSTAGKQNKPYCYRCFTKGHAITVCSTVLCCDICDSDEHHTKACPYSKGAKPTAIPCGYAVDGLGFYYIPYNGKQKDTSDSKSAMVKVSEGSLTVSQFTAELQRLLPGTHKWILEVVGENTFVTSFPSEADLQRMIIWGPVEAKCTKAKMEFSERKDADEWKYAIPKVWIQFRGLSKELRDFPTIWAIGSILGATRKVDMKFTITFRKGKTPGGSAES
ncbi:hypothetical protein BS78_K215100 [Paspalum vaginatum]|uniref:DUF4283 domain-containing protein n=1 Tax=Paspalum vaginatum TaxID=158149 RepID=A0A9W8CDM3_9POAL|nr:hypothetical protein BS78_K215100 [Paspalum vaginatum]